VKAAETGLGLSWGGLGHGVPPAAEDGGLDVGAHQLDNNRCGLDAGGVAGLDAVGLGDDVGNDRDGGENGLVFGGGQDRFEDSVVGCFSGSFGRFQGIFLIRGERDPEDAHGESALALLHVIHLVLEVEYLTIRGFEVTLHLKNSLFDGGQLGFHRAELGEHSIHLAVHGSEAVHDVLLHGEVRGGLRNRWKHGDQLSGVTV